MYNYRTIGCTFTTYKHSTVNYIFERTPPPSAGFKGFLVSWVYDTYSTVLSYLILRSHSGDHEIIARGKPRGRDFPHLRPVLIVCASFSEFSDGRPFTKSYTR